jgi:CPA2 family monovalent cation:H+ antiporter-2
VQEHQAFPFLREILLFLTLAGILIPLLQRLRINQVLGFLAVGALLGPFGLGLLADRSPWLQYLTFPRAEGVDALAELGVLFLMFMIGLELSAGRLWSMRRWVFGAGSAQVCLCAGAIAATALMLGQRTETAIILGLMLSLSSTAVVMPLMTEQHTTATRLGQATFSILMLQDLAVVPLLILIGVMTKGTSGGVASLILITIAKAGAAIAAIYLLGGRVIRPLFRAFTRRHQPDVFMALILLTTLGIGGLAAAAGLSMALGALIAGLMLSETEFKHEVELMIEPFRGLLMGLFFMSVGMGMDLRQFIDAPLWVATVVLGLVAIKAIVVTLLFRLGGLNWGRAAEAGLLLSQGGEFAFVVIGYALSGGLVDAALGQRVILVVGLSLILTPLLARLGRSIGEQWEQRLHAQAAQRDEGELAAVRGHIIIAGYGRVGQMLGKLLEEQFIPYVAFENDAHLASEFHQKGLPVYFGNAARAELLRRVHADEAPAIVLTMDNPASALQAVRGIRHEFPHIPLFARARDEKQAALLKKAGATVVVPETLEASLQLSAFVLESLGLEKLEVDGIVDEERALFNESLSNVVFEKPQALR